MEQTLQPLVRILIGTFLILTVVTLSSVYQKFDSLEGRLLTLEHQLDEARHPGGTLPTNRIRGSDEDVEKAFLATAMLDD